MTLLNILDCFLDSEWSNEYIDFTIMYFQIFLNFKFIFIFVSVIAIWGSKTIVFNSIWFDRKVNLVRAFGRSTFKLPKLSQTKLILVSWVPLLEITIV